jgi:hypothetical protein
MGLTGRNVRAIPLQHIIRENSGTVDRFVLSVVSPITPPCTSTDSLHHDRKLKPGESRTGSKYVYVVGSFT